ncbi:putative cytochrome c oxidase subunit 3 [compost metagenome]
MNSQLLKHIDDNDPSGWSDAPEAHLDRERTAKVGLRVFLCVVSSLFFLFLIAFIARSQIGDWQALTDPVAPLANPWLLWVNTGVLAVASIGLQWARVAARRDNRRGTLAGMIVGGLCALGFLLGQLAVWQQFVDSGYLVSGNPANAFFYLLTGLHGAHLLGGLVAWSRTFARLLNHLPLPRLSGSVGLCATYWHYLLALWVVLLLLLTSSPATYHAIAAFCGLR